MAHDIQPDASRRFCVVRSGVAPRAQIPMSLRSDHRGEFVERCRAANRVDKRVDAEFVVAAPQVLDERVTCDDRSRGAVSLQTAHRPQPCFQPAVVTLDPVVRILDRVMQRALLCCWSGVASHSDPMSVHSDH
jgi:hypothetical protein